MVPDAMKQTSRLLFVYIWLEIQYTIANRNLQRVYLYEFPVSFSKTALWETYNKTAQLSSQLHVYHKPYTLVGNCHGLKMTAADGKIKTVFSLLQAAESQ